jgi:hypothetical protein
VESTFRLPGTLGPEIIVRRGLFGGPSVLADGRPVKRRTWRGQTYDIPLPDGSTKELRLAGEWTGLKAIVDGTELPLERKLAPWEVVLTFLPIGIVAFGGAIGGAFGVLAAAVNTRIARAAVQPFIRVPAMLVVGAIALVAWYAVALAIAPLPRLTTGSCLNGIREGVVVTERNSRPVDCTSAHDNEVIGAGVYPGSGGYPGRATLDAFAEQTCLASFAGYVGVAYESSGLDMITVQPTDQTWLKGDRTVSCIVLLVNGTKLTGSVRGSQR